MRREDSSAVVIETLMRRLLELRPDVGDVEARRIAEVWSGELDQIVERMLTVSEETIGVVVQPEARTMMIVDLTRLLVTLTDEFVQNKLNHGLASDPLTAEAEARASSSPIGRERIENTARLLAEHVWNKCIVDYRRRWPLVVEAGREHDVGRRRKLKGESKAPGVRHNHFSPVFSHKPWSTKDGRVRELSRGLKGDLQHRDIPYRAWGSEEYLYSQRLERHLALIDNDGAESCQKILKIVPMSDLDKRKWIAFLIVQMLRSPGFMLKMVKHTKKILPTTAPEYPNTPAALKAAYESMFTNDDVYAQFHRMIAPKSWQVIAAPAGTTFIRPDATILTEGSIKAGTWNLLYPLSPSKVFVAGPSLGDGYQQEFVPTIAASPELVYALNRRLASIATASVIVHPECDTAEVRQAVSETMSCRARPAGWLGIEASLWGPLAGKQERFSKR